MISFALTNFLRSRLKCFPQTGASFVKKVIEETGGLAAYSVAVVQLGIASTCTRADITIDGKVIPSVGIRTKGFIGSLNPERPSLKVKFDEYLDQSPIEGLDRLTLNNNVQDESLASQYLTYKLFNKVGVPAPRINHAKVTVNGEYLGIYAHVESVRGPFIKRNFGDYSGEFYEGTIADFYPQAVENIEAKNKHSKKKRTQAKKTCSDS